MKIINETHARGKHAVTFLSESEKEDEYLQAMFRATEKHDILDCILFRKSGEVFSSLTIEDK